MPNGSQLKNREAELEQVIERWTRERDADAVMQLLQASGVAAGVARSPYDLAQDPHLRARGHWQSVERPWCGVHVQPLLPFREGEQPFPVRHPAPTLGEHNFAVLTELLGLSADELRRLEADGVIGSEAQPPAAAISRP